MLILNRRIGEVVVIDGGIRVVVLGCDRHGVRLGLEAPPETHIRREELGARSAAGSAPGTAAAASRRRPEERSPT